MRVKAGDHVCVIGYDSYFDGGIGRVVDENKYFDARDGVVMAEIEWDPIQPHHETFYRNRAMVPLKCLETLLCDHCGTDLFNENATYILADGEKVCTRCYEHTLENDEVVSLLD